MLQFVSLLSLSLSFYFCINVLTHSCSQVAQAHTAAGTAPAIARHHFRLIECKDANNNTPLSEASAGGHSSTVELLISLGGDLNYKAQYGRTPLYRAAFGGHFEAAKVSRVHFHHAYICMICHEHMHSLQYTVSHCFK